MTDESKPNDKVDTFIHALMRSFAEANNTDWAWRSFKVAGQYMAHLLDTPPWERAIIIAVMQELMHEELFETMPSPPCDREVIEEGINRIAKVVLHIRDQARINKAQREADQSNPSLERSPQ